MSLLNKILNYTFILNHGQKGFVFKQFQTCFFQKMHKIVPFYLLILILFSTNTYSQKPYAPNYGDPLKEPWRWTNFDELAGKGVRCITESADGDLWFGINNGVVRYNGFDWKEYNSNNGFTENTVFHIVSDNNQNIYAGTNLGLWAFKNEQWEKIFPVGENLNNNLFQRINCLKKLNDGSIIASVGAGLYYGLVTFHQNETTFMASKETIDSIGSMEGVKMQIVPNNKCINNIFCVEEIFQDRKNRIWIWTSQNTEFGHLFYYTLQDSINHSIQYSKNFTSSDGLVQGVRIKFAEDNHGNIWIVNSEFNKGISIFNNSKWK